MCGKLKIILSCTGAKIDACPMALVNELWLPNETPPLSEKREMQMLLWFLKKDLSNDFLQLHTSDHSWQPACGWRVLCSYLVCEPRRPSQGHSYIATGRILHCGHPLWIKHGHTSQESAWERNLAAESGGRTCLKCIFSHCALLPRELPGAVAERTRNAIRLFLGCSTPRWTNSRFHSFHQ